MKLSLHSWSLFFCPGERLTILYLSFKVNMTPVAQTFSCPPKFILRRNPQCISTKGWHQKMTESWVWPCLWEWGFYALVEGRQRELLFLPFCHMRTEHSSSQGHRIVGIFLEVDTETLSGNKSVALGPGTPEATELWGISFCSL
jgi:hypothetical protein